MERNVGVGAHRSHINVHLLRTSLSFPRFARHPPAANPSHAFIGVLSAKAKGTGTFRRIQRCSALHAARVSSKNPEKVHEEKRLSLKSVRCATVTQRRPENRNAPRIHQNPNVKSHQEPLVINLTKKKHLKQEKPKKRSPPPFDHTCAAPVAIARALAMWPTPLGSGCGLNHLLFGTYSPQKANGARDPCESSDQKGLKFFLRW